MGRGGRSLDRTAAGGNAVGSTTGNSNKGAWAEQFIEIVGKKELDMIYFVQNIRFLEMGLSSFNQIS